MCPALPIPALRIRTQHVRNTLCGRPTLLWPCCLAFGTEFNMRFTYLYMT
jgi:hypothetical protein